MRVLTFAACERVIVDVATTSVSLISLLETVNIFVPAGARVDAGVRLPVQWMAFALWEKEDEDRPDLSYEQHVAVVAPTGDIAQQAHTAFKFESSLQRNMVQFDGFPAADGKYKIQLSVHECGSDEQWKIVGEYPVRVIHSIGVPHSPKETPLAPKPAT